MIISATLSAKRASYSLVYPDCPVLLFDPWQAIYSRVFPGINQSALTDEYTRHEETAIFRVTTSILVVRKK